MALKKKITAEQFEKLSADLKTEYIKDGDEYKLDVEGDEDTGALRRAKDREAQARRDAEARAKELEEKLEAIEGDDARKKGDVATLEKSWQAKLDKQKADAEASISKLTSHIQKNLVDAKAMEIASKISKSPALILPHIKARLLADFEGDSPVTRVLDKDGKVSASSLDELQAEFVANPDFSAIIIASKASGGAGGGTKNNGGSGAAPAFKTTDNSADLSSMTPEQLVAHIDAGKANE